MSIPAIDNSCTCFIFVPSTTDNRTKLERDKIKTGLLNFLLFYVMSIVICIFGIRKWMGGVRIQMASAISQTYSPPPPPLKNVRKKSL